MRIYNRTQTTAFFRYAGRGIRGVDLKPAQESPDLPPERVNDIRVQRDLRAGHIGVMINQAEAIALKGLIPEDLLAKCTLCLAAAGDTKTETETATIPFSSEPIPTIPTPEAPKPEDKPIVFERAAVTPPVDPVKDEIASKIAMTAEADRQAQLDRLKASENPAVAKAAEQVQKSQPATNAGGDSWTGKDDSDDPATPGKPAIDTSKYKGLSRAILFSECLKRGINDVNPTTKTKDMRRRLAENDLKPQPAGV